MGRGLATKDIDCSCLTWTLASYAMQRISYRATQKHRVAAASKTTSRSDNPLLPDKVPLE
jgi:hypothetical protein